MTSPILRRASSLVAAAVLLTALAVPVAAVDGGTYVQLANQRRASVGKAAVGLVAIADQISVERANAMAASDDFSHDMAYVEARLHASGICWSGYGEIIAWERGYPTYDASRTMEQWWNSQGHHDIIVGDFHGAGGSHATSSATNKLYSVMIFVKLCTAPPVGTGGDTNFTRVAGASRYDTAAALSRLRFKSGAPVAFVATGSSFPDALAGSPAAAKAGGPILLTATNSLPAATAQELDRLNPSRIVILGGTSAVTGNVANALRAYAGTVQRWSGATRYDTAAAISRSSFSPGVAVAYLATGTNFPDALSGGAVAGRNGGPILLVNRDQLPAATAAELARLRPQKIVVLGGTSVISEAVRSTAARHATTGSATRLAGADRYGTSVAISKSVYGGSAGSSTVFVATGSNFPDGLAGGPVAALVPGPILLVTPNTLPSAIAGELQRLDPETVYVIGGPSAISDGVVNAMDAALP